VIRLAATALVALLALAAPAGASEERPTLTELEPELVCPSCGTTLDLSSAPIAERMRAFIRERIAAGDTKSEIKEQLVAQFGTGVLAEPPRGGFDLLAWALPIAGALAAAAAVGIAAWRWSRTRAPDPDSRGPDPSLNGRAPLEPELERRLEEELARFE
jgi:cytochrome c-type biogenesis protein CcmH/NrfF